MDDTEMDTHAIKGTHYGFSAVRIEDLGATEYTLVAIAADASASVMGFARQIERCIGEVVRSCGSSPRADNLLVRTTVFDDTVEELHGFCPRPSLDPQRYNGTVRRGGATALFDAGENAVASITHYAATLTDADFDCNGIVFVITDGMDNMSKGCARRLAAALSQAAGHDALESMVSILVGVGVADDAVSTYLHAVRRDVGFDQYIELRKADAKTLAKLAAFVSKSIASQSQALGTGKSSRVVGF
ncbi:MAG: hypothetical protein JKY37_17455 [Nannocystaceae bacterium]|nr:hypothetical protein [Nannocystaceae bacterium]